MANQPFLIGMLDIADEYINLSSTKRPQTRTEVNLRDPRVRDSLREMLRLGLFTKECEVRLNVRGVFRLESGEKVTVVPRRSTIVSR